jgi:hypothetical protein
MKTLFTGLFFLLFFSPFSLSAQRRSVVASTDCRQVISVDLGAHRVFVDGPFGGHFGFNIENIVSEKLSFSFNVKDFVNRYSSFTTQTGLVEHRVVAQPSLGFYPRFALHGFYAQAGCGVLLYFDNNKSPLTVSKDDGLWQLFPDVKLGFQSIDADNFAWNLYIGSGLSVPKKAFNMMPVFEAGVKLGLKL